MIARQVERLDRLYRRTGGNVPFGDPLPSHGAEMEGYFWRFTDAVTGRVVVALCGVNQHPDGAWATVAVATHPNGLVRSVAAPLASASTERFEVRVEGVLEATAERLTVELGDARVDVELRDRFGWPHATGGGGVFSAVPFLGQYWHPHILGGRATGTVTTAGDQWSLDGANVYAEKNWGAGFPVRWWWGQAQGFQRDDVCVAFSGGVLTAGPVAMTVGGAIVRVGDDVLRLTPPAALVRSTVNDQCWSVDARGARTRVRITGDGTRMQPHVLPVPLPAERRNADTDFEHLAAHLELEVTRNGKTLFEGASDLAALEVGYRPGDEKSQRWVTDALAAAPAYR